MKIMEKRDCFLWVTSCRFSKSKSAEEKREREKNTTNNVNYLRINPHFSLLKSSSIRKTRHAVDRALQLVWSEHSGRDLDADAGGGWVDRARRHVVWLFSGWRKTRWLSETRLEVMQFHSTLCSLLKFYSFEEKRACDASSHHRAQLTRHFIAISMTRGKPVVGA